MALDKNSNAFTFIFSIVMVVVVGAALSFASISLKPMQEKNALDKKMMNILASVGVQADRQNADEMFYDIVKKRIMLNNQGEVTGEAEGPVDPKNTEDPFNVDIRKEFRSPDLKPEDRHYPLFIAEINGEEVMVIPLAGKGLWGPIWGYISLEGDMNTIYGASFDHSSETPGLGAEIREAPFQSEFKGKTIYDASGDLVSITVQKGGVPPDAPHAVDAITGGTITSKGVQEMIGRTMGVYDAYFKKNATAVSSKQ